VVRWLELFFPKRRAPVDKCGADLLNARFEAILAMEDASFGAFGTAVIVAVISAVARVSSERP